VSDDYVQASKLEVMVLRPKKVRVVFEVRDREEWEQLWLMERPRFAGLGRPIPEGARQPTVFSLTLVALPRRMAFAELTKERAIELAKGEIEVALNDTAADRSTLAGRIATRDATNETNKRGGADASGGRD